MAKIIDLSGLACPGPVIRTKETLEAGETRGIYRGGGPRGRPGQRQPLRPEPGLHRVRGPIGLLLSSHHLTARRPDPGDPLFPRAAPAPQSTAVVFASDRMGDGDPELGAILMRAFCQTIVQVQAPQKLLFYNRGVLLTLDDSPVLHELKGLEEMGVGLLVCGTCLDFYKVRDRLAVGQVSNMFSILEAQMAAGRIIKP